MRTNIAMCLVAVFVSLFAAQVAAQAPAGRRTLTSRSEEAGAC